MTKRIAPFIVFLLSFLNCWSFDYQDSLWNVVNNSAKSNRSAKAGALLELSKFYWTNNTDSAVSMSNQVIELGEELGDSKIMGDGYFNLGMIEYVNGSFSIGYSSFLSASEFYKQSNQVFETSQSLLQAGVCLREIEQYEKALALLNEGYQYITDTHHHQLAYSIAKELGEVYALVKEDEQAESYFIEAIKIAEVHGDTVAAVESYISIGCFYQDVFENNKSLNSFHSSLKLVKPENKQLLAQLYNHIGESHLQKNQLKEANEFFSLALIAAKEGKSIYVQSRSHYNLSKIYEIQQKYALALIEYKLFSQINDSINAVIKTQSISDLQAKFDNVTMSKEMHLKDIEIEKTEVEKLESQLNAQNQAFQNKLIFGGLLLVLAFGLILLFAFRKQRKLNIQLDQLSIVAKEIDNTVIITDGEGDIEWVNESYTNRSGLTLEQFKKKYDGNIFKNPPNDTVKAKIEEAITTKKSVEFYLSAVTSTVNVALKTTLTPKVNKDGEIEKFIFIDTDISELVEAEKEITSQRDTLQNIYTQLTESIDYAQRIQEAILPHSTKISKFFKEYYLLYQPKDVVSGDFYFLEETDKFIYFAGADCTGHGVPGALMSVICHNLLENAVHRGFENTAEILKELNNQIIKKLRQGSESEENIKDGLDIALCRISKEDDGKATRKVQFSGAHSALYIIHNGDFKEVKPDRVHLGLPLKTEDSITSHELIVEAGSELILFSDGFPDQKGGELNKKYFYQPFRELLIKTAKLSPDQKVNFLSQNFKEWKGTNSQADDVFVWGLKI